MRVGAQLAANVQDVPALHRTRHRFGAPPVLYCSRQKEAAENMRIRRRAPSAMLAPVSVIMPGDKTDQRVIDFVDEAPDPVKPERPKAIQRRPSDPGLPTWQEWSKEPGDLLGHLLVDAAVAIEGNAAGAPRAIWLVTQAPIPVGHRLPPTLDRTPNYGAAAAGESARRILVIPIAGKSTEVDHGRGARV